jgi:hypothetical protein
MLVPSISHEGFFLSLLSQIKIHMMFFIFILFMLLKELIIYVNLAQTILLLLFTVKFINGYYE